MKLGQALVGAALIAFSIGNSPLIPDEPVLVPAGIALIIDAFGVKL